MFTPQVVWAHEFLAGANPPRTVRWWPAQSYVSCDGAHRGQHRPATYAGGRGPAISRQSGSANAAAWRWAYDAGDALKVARPIPNVRSSARHLARAGRHGRRCFRSPRHQSAAARAARRLWRRPLGGRDPGVGLEGRRQGRAAIPHLPVERRALRAGHPRPHRRRKWLGTCVDRAVRLGFGHLPGDHRPAGLRADFRQPDARHFGGAPPRDGGRARRSSLAPFRFAGKPMLHARHQPRQLPIAAAVMPLSARMVLNGGPSGARTARCSIEGTLEADAFGFPMAMPLMDSAGRGRSPVRCCGCRRRRCGAGRDGARGDHRVVGLSPCWPAAAGPLMCASRRTDPGVITRILGSSPRSPPKSRHRRSAG